MGKLRDLVEAKLRTPEELKAKMAKHMKGELAATYRTDKLSRQADSWHKKAHNNFVAFGSRDKRGQDAADVAQELERQVNRADRKAELHTRAIDVITKMQQKVQKESEELTEMTKFCDYPLSHHALNQIHDAMGHKNNEGLHEIPKGERQYWQKSESALKSRGHTHKSIETGLDKYYDHVHQHGHDQAAKASNLPGWFWNLADKHIHGV
jgi:hypothetical protein